MRGVTLGGAQWDDEPKEMTEEQAPVDDGPMGTHTVRMPDALTWRMERFWAQYVETLTGKRYNLSAAARYLIAVGLCAIEQGHWQVKAEPSDKLEMP